MDDNQVNDDEAAPRLVISQISLFLSKNRMLKVAFECLELLNLFTHSQFPRLISRTGKLSYYMFQLIPFRRKDRRVSFFETTKVRPVVYHKDGGAAKSAFTIPDIGSTSDHRRRYFSCVNSYFHYNFLVFLAWISILNRMRNSLNLQSSKYFMVHCNWPWQTRIVWNTIKGCGRGRFFRTRRMWRNYYLWFQERWFFHVGR